MCSYKSYAPWRLLTFNKITKSEIILNRASRELSKLCKLRENAFTT